MDRCTGCCDTTEILLQMALNIIPSINQKAYILIKNKLSVTQSMKSVFERAENTIVGIKEKAGHQHFLLFQKIFEKASFLDSLKSAWFSKWVNNCSV